MTRNIAPLSHCSSRFFELFLVRSSTLSLPTEDQKRCSLRSHHTILTTPLPDTSQYSSFRSDSQHYSSINNKYLYLRIDNTWDGSWQFGTRALPISHALTSVRHRVCKRRRDACPFVIITVLECITRNGHRPHHQHRLLRRGWRWSERERPFRCRSHRHSPCSPPPLSSSGSTASASTMK